jgi:acetolactate synthase-1/2/3 large subunit
MRLIEGHAGEQAVAALCGFGVDTMFTLNGGHIWPLYDAARNQRMAVVDVRHESSAAFAAEAYAKLTRRPGLAALTAGPGLTNGVSATTSAWFNGSPVVVLGGRAPQGRWGAGSLQEMDHLPIYDSITKSATTVFDPTEAGRIVHDAVSLAATPHRGPVMVDFPLDVFGPAARAPERAAPDPDALVALAEMVATADRPAFMVGSDAYWDHAEAALAAAATSLGVPCFFNGMGRGMLPADHELAFLRTRGLLKQRADLVVVLGTPLDFRLGFGTFGEATVAHVVDSESQRAGHVDVHTVVGDISQVLTALADYSGPRRDHRGWIDELRDAERRGATTDAELLAADRTVRPDARIALLLGDGAAGFSLMDVDTLVRHRLPVVMIVGNNGMWGLEKHPMQAIYGWDLACDLQQGCRYDEVVRALGGAGETVADPGEIGPALDRAFASDVPYLVNVLTDPDDVYPRSSNLG